MAQSSGPIVTVSHNESAEEVKAWGINGPEVIYQNGLDVEAQIVYRPSQSREALAAVDRLAASLRRQIADAAESIPLDDLRATVAAACRREQDAEAES